MLFSTEQLLSFSLATIGLAAIPGPDLVYVIIESIQQGKRKGIAVATGLVSGVFVHTTAVASGVSLLLISSPLAFTVIKILGAIYLAYLGVLALWNKEQLVFGEGSNPHLTNFQLFKRGIFMNLVNPKVSLFFIAFLPQFIDPDENIVTQSFVLGIIFIILSWIVFAIASVLSGQLTQYLKNPRIQYRIQMSKGIFFLLIALQIVFLD